MPTGWDRRLIRSKSENTRGVTALCLDPVDLAASKLAAGRRKDKDFVTEMLRHRLIELVALRERLRQLPQAEHRKAAELSLRTVEGRMGTSGPLRATDGVTVKVQKQPGGPSLDL